MWILLSITLLGISAAPTAANRLAKCTHTRIEHHQQEHITPERRKWLEEAFQSLASQDPVKAMLGYIQVILRADSSVEEKEEALEELEVYCEDLDLACDFHKIGGYEFLLSQLHSSEAGIRWRAAFLIGTLVQNNPYCQEKAFEVNLLPTLLQLIDQDPHTEVKIKALYAVSALCRDVPAGQKVFVDHDGFSVVLRAMQTENEKLQLKSSFMLRAMCVSQPQFKDTLCSMGMVEQLVSLLRREHTASHEHLLGALYELARDHEPSLAECTRSELAVEDLLRQRKAMLQGQPAFEEELAHATALQQLLAKSGRTATIDR